jgi:hypothetical protein
MKTHPLAAAALAAVLCGSAAAVENGAPITPFGVMDFGAGLTPPTTEFGVVGLRLARYRAKELRDNNGDKPLFPANPKVSVDSAGLVFIKMTDLTLGNARFGWGAALPWLDGSVEFSVPAGPPPAPLLNLSGKKGAQGDIQLIPAILAWTPSPGWYTNAQLQLQLPTGSYDRARLFNPGTNHWTASPVFAFTHIMPSGLEVSSNIQLNFHGRNKDTNYKSGVEVQHEFAVGQHVGSWTFGLGGYLYQQLTDDKAPGLANGNRARVAALGPAVNFFELGSGLPVVWVHAYKEFNARNRAQGTQITARLAWAF